MRRGRLWHSARHPTGLLFNLLARSHQSLPRTSLQGVPAVGIFVPVTTRSAPAAAAAVPWTIQRQERRRYYSPPPRPHLTRLKATQADASCR